MNPSPEVIFQRCDSYEEEPLRRCLDESLGRQARFSPRGAKVFVKPNLLSARMGSLACTDIRFLEVLCDWLLARGAVVAVGDSPAFGTASSVLHSLGALERLRHRGVRIVDFHRVVRKTLSCGVDVAIGAEILEHDIFINFPKVKAHSQMYVTMAVKNIFGIVAGMRKSMLHMLHGGSASAFSAIILDLQEHLPRHFSVADGIVAMHRQGPVRGEPLALGCYAFGEDPVALDTALLAALQLDCGKSPLWREASGRKLPGSRRSALRYPALQPEDFHGSGFLAPGELTPIRFNPLRFVGNNLKRTVLHLRGRWQCGS